MFVDILNSYLFQALGFKWAVVAAALAVDSMRARMPQVQAVMVLEVAKTLAA